MTLIEATTADRAWRQAAQLLHNTGQVQSGRDQPTRELVHVVFSLSDARQRLVFGRPINPAFAVAEVIWILSGGNAAEFITAWNSRMSDYVDPDSVVFHGAYGHRLGSQPALPDDVGRALRIENTGESLRLDQVRAAYDALMHSPDSRQIVLQIWDSDRDLPDPEPRSVDVPCNLVSHLMVRNDRLEWLQVMRSNDLMWGTPYNFIQFTTLQEIIAGWIGVEVGNYVHVSDSLHVYQRHWNNLENVAADEGDLPVNRADLRIEGYDDWEKAWGQVAHAALRLANAVTPDEAQTIVGQMQDVPAGYVEWVALLASESLRRCGYAPEAESLINHAGEYWATSWRRWHQRKLVERDSVMQ